MNRPEKGDAFAPPPRASITMRDRTAAFERRRPYVLSLLRIMAGRLFLEHGMAKVFGFPPHGAIPVYPNIEWFAGRIELFGGTLVALGLWTRPIAFLVSGEMAVGYFLDHAPRSFFPLLNGGDSIILYCFVFLYLVFAGAGSFSLDALIRRNGGR